MITAHPTATWRVDGMLRRIGSALVFVWACACFSPIAYCQPSAGEFKALDANVTVLDENGSPMRQMDVRAVNHEYGFRVAATTDADGRAILGVMPGTWSFFATPAFGRLGDSPGKGYLLVHLGERFDASSRSIALAPTETVTVDLVSAVFDFTACNNYVGFVVEPYGEFVDAHPSGFTTNGTLILHTNGGLKARSYVQSTGAPDEALYFVQEAKELASVFRIQVTSANSAILKFNARDQAGNPTDYHIELQAHGLTWAWSPFTGDLDSRVGGLRVSPNEFYMMRGVDAYDALSVRHRILLNPLVIRPQAGQTMAFDIGGKLRVAAVRTAPRAAHGFTPATQIMLAMQDAYGNSVAEVRKWSTGMLVPSVQVHHGSVTSPPFEVYGFFASKLLEQFERAEDPHYEIAWDFGPWGSGSMTGELYGQEERRLAVDETESLLSQAPRLDRSYRLAQVSDYQRFAHAMQDLVGVPVDYKMGVISNIAHAGFEDEVQHAYKLEIAIELGTATGWVPGSGFMDHEAGHARIHRPPCRFSAIGPYGEVYATLVGAKARSAVFGGNEYLNFLLGGHDLFLRHQHGAPLSTDADYIETMQFVTHYINAHYGWTPHRRMILEWENAFRLIRSRLVSAGYSDMEQLAIVYSWLCGENLSALFQAAGFPITSPRVADGLAVMQSYFDSIGETRLGVGVNSVEAPGTSIPVELIAGRHPGVSSIEFALKYDSSKARVSRVYRRDLTDSDSWSLTSDTSAPGIVRVHLSGKSPVTGLGSIAQINLSLLPNASGPVDFSLADARANGSPVSSVNGSLMIPATPLIGPFPNLADAIQGKPYSCDLWAAGAAPPYKWSVVEDALPPGLTLDASTGRIHGQASAQGEYLFRVEAVDTVGKASRRWFTIRVLPRSADPSPLSPDGAPPARP